MFFYDQNIYPLPIHPSACLPLSSQLMYIHLHPNRPFFQIQLRHNKSQTSSHPLIVITVKPVCNNHLSDKIYSLWFIQQCVLIETECTNLLLQQCLTTGAHLGGPWPPRWAPEGREVSHCVVAIDRFHCICNVLIRELGYYKLYNRWNCALLSILMF